jgi:hypothetical protein
MRTNHQEFVAALSMLATNLAHAQRDRPADLGRLTGYTEVTTLLDRLAGQLPVCQPFTPRTP